MNHPPSPDALGERTRRRRTVIALVAIVAILGGAVAGLLVLSPPTSNAGVQELQLAACDPAGLVPCNQQAAFVSVPIADSGLALTYSSQWAPGRKDRPDWSMAPLRLGGWAVDALQRYDAKNGVVIGGDGSWRVVRETPAGSGEQVVPSFDGSVAYVFDTSGRHGELIKLGHIVAATTIRSWLIAAGIPPSPRRVGMSWKQLLAAQARSLIAADFLSVDTIFFKRLYVLIYVHLASRRLLLASCTARPDDAWMTQQARNLIWRLEDEGFKLRFVVHDRDKKFAAKADHMLTSAGARVIVTPLMAPRANAHCERLVGTIGRECLDWMLVLNQHHL